MRKEKGEVILDTGDGYNWQRLSPEQAAWEGGDKQQSNCVGGYCDDMRAGRTQIYSLRENDTNKPKITLSTGYDKYGNMGRPDYLPRRDLDQPLNVVGQIKGRANRIRPEFAPHVQQLADHLGLDLSGTGDWYMMNPELANAKRDEYLADLRNRAMAGRQPEAPAPAPEPTAPAHHIHFDNLRDRWASGLTTQEDFVGQPIDWATGHPAPPGPQWLNPAFEDLEDEPMLDPYDPHHVIDFLNNRLQSDVPAHPGSFSAFLNPNTGEHRIEYNQQGHPDQIVGHIPVDTGFDPDDFVLSNEELLNDALDGYIHNPDRQVLIDWFNRRQSESHPGHLGRYVLRRDNTPAYDPGGNRALQPAHALHDLFRGLSLDD
jgi:hypothetical protein